MGGLFSSLGAKNGRTQANGVSVGRHDIAVLDLKVQRDKLHAYQTKLEGMILREQEIALALLKQDKRQKALLALKTKRYQQSLLEKSERQLQNIQEMVDSLEFAQLEQKVFASLKAGNAALEQIHRVMSVEAVEDLLSETQEALETQREIEQMLGSHLTKEDEEDIELELEALQKEEALHGLPEVPQTSPVTRPDEKVPTPEPKQTTKGEPKEKVMLAAS
ncbi:Vacuolar protein sorting-associated protein 20 [Balamuthia mandrillaris]